MKPITLNQLNFIFIKENEDCIIQSLKVDICKYVYIRKKFRKFERRNKYEFQRQYKDIFKLNQSRFIPQWLEEYFKLLDEYYKQQGNKEIPDIKEILKKLYEVPSHRKGKKNKLWFSYATKLMHMAAPTKFPIYDSIIADFLGIQKSSVGEFEKRINQYEEIYTELIKFYNSEIRKGTFNDVIKKFDKVYPEAENISTIKKIDFILWKAGKLKCD